MPRNLIAAAALAAALSSAVLGCTTNLGRTTAKPAPFARPSHGLEGAPAVYQPWPVTMADATHCPVTIGHPVPLTPKTAWRDSLFGWPSAYGNGSLWVGSLWQNGVVIITPDNVDPDGRLSMKFGWYRLTSGFLTITGRRLDAPAPSLSGDTAGYGPTGFNASAVIFPTEGCWQVTGQVGRVKLTFVTFVIKGHCDLTAVPIQCIADRVR